MRRENRILVCCRVYALIRVCGLLRLGNDKDDRWTKEWLQLLFQFIKWRCKCIHPLCYGMLLVGESRRASSWRYQQEHVQSDAADLWRCPASDLHTNAARFLSKVPQLANIQTTFAMTVQRVSRSWAAVQYRTATFVSLNVENMLLIKQQYSRNFLCHSGVVRKKVVFDSVALSSSTTVLPLGGDMPLLNGVGCVFPIFIDSSVTFLTGHQRIGLDITILIWTKPSHST